MIPEQLRNQLNQTHSEMLDLHKMLLEHERVRYERGRAPIQSPNEFLRLLLNDPWFAWLRPMSMLMAQIDEYVSSKKPQDAGEGEALLVQAKKLLTPNENGDDFQRNYHRSIQESPQIANAHALWKQFAAQFR